MMRCFARDVARRDRLVLTVSVVVMLAGAPSAAFARQLKLWPLFDYASDPTTGTLSVKVLGPLAEYQRDPQYTRIALRPPSGTCCRATGRR